MSNNAHELSNRLLNALDNNYNVVDMHTVNEIISILEGINITKELLETTRLGKHVNELRRKTTDPTLARRAKVLVKRWRDLVIPTVASPGHTGSNRSSAERTTVRRLGGTPLTSPALSRQVVSPAVPSPRPPSRPAWGGYESDSQDVILVDDEPPPPPPILTNTHKPLTPTVKRPPSPEPLHDEKKAKRDRRLKKKRGYSRAGSGAEAAVAGGGGITTPAPGTPGALAPGAGNWARHNGAHERRRNGTTPNLDPYSALVHRLPPAGAKKVKTTQELLEQIQSRGNKAPASPEEPDVMLIEPNDCIKAESPLRNGGSSPRPLPVKCPSGPPSRAPSPALEPLEDAREYYECTCGEEEEDPACPAAAAVHIVQPRHVHALHHALVAGVNGTRAPALAPRFAVRSAPDPLRHGLFASVVPLYKYSDYADDYCVKNMSQVPLCQHLPWTEFAPPPPDLPPPPSPPPIRPYPPIDDPDDEQKDVKIEVKLEETSSDGKPEADIKAEIEFKMEVDVEAKAIEPKDVIKSEPEEPPEAHERLKACPAEEPEERPLARAPPDAFVGHTADHRTVERTREDEGGGGAGGAGGGAALLRACGRARGAVPYCYEQLLAAPELSREALRSDRAVGAALGAPGPAGAERDPLGRPPRPARFAEWHESAELGALVALPYVVID